MSRGQNCVIECADGEIAWEASDDDAMVRTEREPHDVAESHVSSQDGQALDSGVPKDCVVRLTTQTDVAGHP